MLESLKTKWKSTSLRSKLAVKNILASLVLRATSIVTTLMIVPLTIDYLDGAQYGVWLTVSSIITWVNFFDLGLSNGLRNRFAEALAKDDILLARKYLSTTYAFISMVVAGIFLILCLLNHFVDLATLLNISQDYKITLHKVFFVLSIFFCLNMVANVIVKVIEADQRPALASLISCIAQIISLTVIYILTKTTEGNLLTLAIYFGGIPSLTVAVSSIFMYTFTRYRKYRPSFKLIKFSMVKDLLQLGVKFFLTYLCMIVVFQIMDIVLSRECGVLSVTQYNVAYKYFSVIYMVIVLIVNPMWSAFTDAYTRKDYIWMKSVLKNLEKCVLIAIGICIVMLVLSQIAYHIWIGDKVEISNILSFGVMMYVIAQIIGALYLNLINGVGTIFIQLMIYLVFACISYPLMTICCRYLGPVGIVVVPGLVYSAQAIISRIQLWKIINNKASGIWLK